MEQFVSFTVVVRERSISSASRRLHIPQQSLSSSVHSLEQELGVRLLTRFAGGVRPTEAGLAVYDYMEQFLQGYKQLCEGFHPQRQEQRTYPLTIAAQNNMLQTVIPQLTSDLLKAQSPIALDVWERPQDEIIALVEREEIALGIILCFVKGEEIYPRLPERLIFRQVFASRPYFWMNRRHPLARLKSLSMDLVRDYPIAQNTNADEKMFQFIFAQRFGVFDIGVQTANIHLLQQLVRENMVLCPDLKMMRGELAFAYLFHDQPVVAKPLAARDNYKMVTGCLFKRGRENAPELEQLLAFFGKYQRP